jgi:hypothetical protein
MTNSPTDAVVAGSKSFAVALLAPLTARIGVRPRITSDAPQALALCRGPSGLVVIEYAGDATLSGVEALVRDGGGLRVVAALPAAHAAAEPALRALGVEVARWDGRPDDVIGAVDRIAAAPAAASAPVAAPARRAAPALSTPAPGAAPAKPAAAATPRPPPAAPRPAAAAPARAPAPAAKPLARAPAVKPATGAAPAGKPAPPPAAAPAADPFAAALAAAALDDGEERTDAGRVPFVGGDPLDVDVDDAMSAIAPATPSIYVPPPAPPPAGAPADWPATAPTLAEAEAALLRAIAGEADGSVAAHVAAGLSEIELAVLGGRATSVEPGPIRRAAVMRVRVAAALAATPPAGTPVDTGAVHALLGDIDALLSTVAALAASAPADVQASLEAVRNALVREAIDFSEAVQRVGAARAEPIAPPVVRPTRPATGAVTVLREDVAPPPSRRGVWVVAALMLLGAGAYHAHRHFAGPVPPATPTLAGAPDGLALVTHKGQRRLVRLPGRKIDVKAFEDFRAKQSAQGVELREISPGTWLLSPATAAEPGGTR